MVIFGGTGDLARRKLVPALYNLAKDGSLPANFGVAGVGRSERTTDSFREMHFESTGRFSRSKPLCADTWNRFAEILDYVAGDLNDPGTYARLREWLRGADGKLGTRGNRIYYFATPASDFATILRHLKEAGLLYPPEAKRTSPWSRVVIEKPFGRDLTLAQALNRLVAESLDESRVFRIDHYLGKETVQNILVFRFGNAIFEPLWNRKYVDHVQITAAEEIGIEGRGHFYDETGILRDIIQNHLLQVLSLFAMEPPVSFAADDIRDKKVEALRALRPLRGEQIERDVVMGQYRGYREEREVARDSRAPTYAALRLFLDNWRWQGVPFYVRAGKRLKKRITEIAIHFQSIPLCLFQREDACLMEPNVLTLRIQPDEGIALKFACKVPGEDITPRGVTMDFSYARAFEKPIQEAYERLLLDAMRGDATLFWRRDGVEHAWKFVTPILEATESNGKLALYEPGSSGPREADELLSRENRSWRELS